MPECKLWLTAAWHPGLPMPLPTEMETLRRGRGGPPGFWANIWYVRSCLSLDGFDQVVRVAFLTSLIQDEDASKVLCNKEVGIE